jgi:diguanylate cyclase (GGDEF)-like protein
MHRLVDVCAPRSGADAAIKIVAFLVLILATDQSVVALLGVEIIDPWTDALRTAAVGLPFTVLALSLLLHQRRLQVQLVRLATTDALTGLPNRRDFMGRARLAAEEGRAGALLLIDADHFKRINDAFGHAAGDACLVAIAERLRAGLRPGDLVGRLGGEEFAAFLPGATRAETARVGAELCAAIPVDAQAAGKRLAVTLSAGAALSQGPTPLDRLMADADRALYEAKARGRARVVVWPPDETPARAA